MKVTKANKQLQYAQSIMKTNLNKYRQVKDCVYTHPHQRINKNIIKHYCELYPNDKELGEQIRKLYEP